VEQRDSARAANHAVNVANLEPTSPLLRRVLPTIPEGDLAGALMARGAAVPLPESYVQLDDPLGNYEEFVLDELSRGYWNTAFGHFTGIGADAGRQVIPQLPPEVFNRLPPDIQATLRAQGVGPGSPLEVLSPTASRAHYPRLNLHLLRYQRRYLYELSSAYRQGVVELVIEDLRQRTHEYSEQYAAAAKGGGDPIGAMNAYCRNVIGAMNGSHARFPRALAFSREVGNRILREDWSAIAGLIALVPEAYRIDEVSYLRRLGALNSQYYTGCLVRWYSLGARAVLLDRMLADAAADALHAGAAARELESIMARERREAALEAELEDGEGLELPIEQWVGLDLGVFAIKVIGDEEIEISGGEALVGEASYNWEDLEFELGIGVGIGVPTVGPVGGEGKVLGVVRIGGPEEFGLGIHSSAEISAGTPVAGIEVDVIDDYLWIANAGHPDDAIIGSPWREP
jgi:hypothetical protein